MPGLTPSADEADAREAAPVLVGRKSFAPEPLPEREAEAIGEGQRLASSPTLRSPLAVFGSDWLDFERIAQEKLARRRPRSAPGTNLLSDLRPVRRPADASRQEGFFDDLGPRLALQIREQCRGIEDRQGLSSSAAAALRSARSSSTRLGPSSSLRTRFSSCSRVSKTIPSADSIRMSGVPSRRSRRWRSSAGSTTRPLSPTVRLYDPLMSTTYHASCR